MSRLMAISLGIYLVLASLISNPALADSASASMLSPCPPSPNCVVSQGADEKHAITPLSYHTDRETARQTLLQVLGVTPRTEVVEETDSYIHALAKSRIFKFIDDVEFYLPENEQIIHVRSAARVGESDLGVNRRRIEQIRLALQDLNT